MDVVDKTDIQEYAKRNTSPKMPIEAKYVEAFLDALMNSTKVQDVYEILSDHMQNGDTFVIYNSFFNIAKNVNREPFRSIIAYSMLKKDLRLFELISASIFTGSVIEYHGSDLYTEISTTTDEVPWKYTDTGIYTDMNPGMVQIGFKNYYCDDPLEDGTGSEYQTISELNDALNDFYDIITLTKPARVKVIIFFVPWCFISGDSETCITCGIDQNYEYFDAPFGDEISMNIISNMNTTELLACYNLVSMVHYETIEIVDPETGEITYDTVATERTDLTYERRVTIGPRVIYFDYDLRCISTENAIWDCITIRSNAGDKVYAVQKTYKPEEDYYEKYNPIMLKINDNDPDGPCLALELQRTGPEEYTPTVGAMFYIRESV